MDLKMMHILYGFENNAYFIKQVYIKVHNAYFIWI